MISKWIVICDNVEDTLEILCGECSLLVGWFIHYRIYKKIRNDISKWKQGQKLLLKETQTKPSPLLQFVWTQCIQEVLIGVIFKEVYDIYFFRTYFQLDYWKMLMGYLWNIYRHIMLNPMTKEQFDIPIRINKLPLFS